MKRSAARGLVLLIGAVVVLAAAGCAADGHQEAINAATVRWLAMRSAQMLAIGQQQFDAGDLKQAQDTVEDALGFDPLNAKLLVLAGRINIEKGLLERAYHLFNKAIEADDTMPEAQFFKGLVMQRWQKYDDALSCYQQAYDLEADNIGYLLAISEMLVALDRLDDARDLLEDKMTYFEQNAGIREALGKLSMAQGDHAEARDYFKEAAVLQPDDLRIREELAMARLAVGDYEEAAADLEFLLAQDQIGERPNLRFALVRAHQGAEQLDEARELCFRLTRRNPKDVKAWRLLADLSWLAGDLAAALTAAGRVCRLDPRKPEGYLMAGMVWQKRGDLKQAVGFFEKAAQADEQNARPAILKGIALEEGGRLAAAAAAYREALRRQPDDPKANKLLRAVEAGL